MGTNIGLAQMSVGTTVGWAQVWGRHIVWWAQLSVGTSVGWAQVLSTSVRWAQVSGGQMSMGLIVAGHKCRVGTSVGSAQVSGRQKCRSGTRFGAQASVGHKCRDGRVGTSVGAQMPVGTNFGVAQISVGTQVSGGGGQKCRLPQVSVAQCRWAQVSGGHKCRVGTNVGGRKCRWAQVSVGTIVGGHKYGVGTIVWWA